MINKNICTCGHDLKEHLNENHGRRGKVTSCDYATQYKDNGMGILRPIDPCPCKKFKPQNNFPNIRDDLKSLKPQNQIETKEEDWENSHQNQSQETNSEDKVGIAIRKHNLAYKKSDLSPDIFSTEDNLKDNPEPQTNICTCGHERIHHKVLRCVICGYTKRAGLEPICNNCKGAMIEYNIDLSCHKKKCPCKKFQAQNQSPLETPDKIQGSESINQTLSEDTLRGIFSTEDLEKEIIKEVNKVLCTNNGKIKYDESRQLIGMEKLCVNLTIEKTSQRLKAEVEKVLENLHLEMGSDKITIEQCSESCVFKELKKRLFG